MEPTIPQAETPEVAPEPVAPEKEPASPSIPKARFDEELGKRKSAEAENQKLRTELEELRGKKAPPKVEPSKSGAPEDQSLNERLARIEERDSRRELQRALALQDEKQTEAVAAILKSNPDLKATEALTIAQARQPDLFNSVDPRAYNPGQHGSLRPISKGPLQVEKTLAERAKTITEIKDPVTRAREEKRLYGKELAKVLGWQRPD